ncbi:MAG: AMP-binding protein [Acidobacteria bacterium]|nr:AMP-binding protein [Acidobacteriota bacterium]
MPDQGPTPPAAERQTRTALAERQSRRLAELLAAIDGRNAFYTRKLAEAGLKPAALRLPGDLRVLPFTTRHELAADQDAHPPWGTNLTEPPDRYSRYHQTSSTTGRPLRWMDTGPSWQWVVDCWKSVYGAAGVTAADRIFFPFGFGPFIGFWAGFDAGAQLGALCIPGGGMSSESRLRMLDAVQPTVVCCTPTYALRLAEVARASGLVDLAAGPVRTVIVAGEPGGHVPATRERIERDWGARVIDHHGLTEVGPLSFECREATDALHLNESEFVCEVVDPASGTPVPPGEAGELVVTNLGRTASPVIRYRTGDIVQVRQGTCACGRTLARAVGGILSRADDMVWVRGVNVYPTAVEAVIRRFAEVVEYRCTVSTRGARTELAVEVELRGNAADTGAAHAVGTALHEALGLTVPIRVVDADTLPRFELKARRFVVEGPTPETLDTGARQ